jgi:hypothetical protein
MVKMSNPFNTDGASAPFSVTRQNYERELQNRANQELIMKSSPQVQNNFQNRANYAQTREAMRAGTQPEDDRWEPATTVVIIYACGSPRAYSAKNSDQAELQGVKNVYQNAVNQDMQVAMFTYKAQYPAFWEQVLSNIAFGYKWWSENVKDLKMVKSNRVRTGFIKGSTDESLGLTFTNYLLDQIGVSDVGIAKKIVKYIFKASPPGKIICTMLNLYNLGRNINKVRQSVGKYTITDEKLGADYIDMIFVTEPSEAKNYYFDDFETLYGCYKNYSFKEASSKIGTTIVPGQNLGTTRIELQERKAMLKRVGKLIIQVIQIDFNFIDK